MDKIYIMFLVLGKLNFNVGGIFHTVLMESLYSTLPCSRYTVHHVQRLISYTYVCIMVY